MYLRIFAMALLALSTASAGASSVCVLTGNIYSGRQSCDGANFKDMSLSGALKALVDDGYQITNTTTSSDGGTLNYTLVKK